MVPAAGFDSAALGSEDAGACCATQALANKSKKRGRREIFIKNLQLPETIAIGCRTAAGGCFPYFNLYKHFNRKNRRQGTGAKIFGRIVSDRDGIRALPIETQK